MLLLVIVYNRNARRRQREQFNFILQAQEAERNRIAFDLHDGVIGTLYAFRIHFSGEAKKLEKYDYLNALLNDALADIYKSVYHLTSTTLQRFGLVAALDDICARLRQPNLRIDTHYEIKQHDYHSDFIQHVYRIAAELLQNMSKHSQARFASVHLTEEKNTLIITISDDGIGFDPDVVKASASMGLKSLSYRAKLLGGTFEVYSEPGHGMNVKVTLPIGKKPAFEKSKKVTKFNC